MTDISIKDILKSCFLVGYWLGKAGAQDHSDDYYRQRDLTIKSCEERLLRLLNMDVGTIEERGDDGETRSG